MRNTKYWSTIALGLLITAGGIATIPEAKSAGLESRYEMNEGGGNVLVDSNGLLNGTVGTTLTRWSSNGDEGLFFPYRQPSKDPADPQRLALVQGAPSPGSGNFRLTVRYQTNQSYGNITQKGQSGGRGLIKMENPGGIPRCTVQGFRDGQKVAVTVKNPTTLKGDELHTVTCARVGNTFTFSVDGTVVSTRNRNIGGFENNYPLSIGGKSNCDGVKITCDYFNGRIDYVEWSVG